MRPRLFARKTIWWPTWQGWSALVVLGLALLGGGLLRIHPLLSVSQPAPANVLVIEGWLPDYAVELAYAEFQRNHYDYVVTAGGPLPKGKPILGYGSYAEVTAATLRALGCSTNRLIEARGNGSARNRTWESARAVGQTLEQRGIKVTGLNVVSLGAHARRTWLVYQKALKAQFPVGVLAYPSEDYDQHRWWSTSEGVKVTLTEGFGWCYERLFNAGR